jgi:hypothetical protein
MTETPDVKKRPERVLVKPDPDSRLASLLCLYETRKAEADAAEKAYDELKKSVLTELEAMTSEDERPSKAYDIVGSPMWPPVSYTYISKFYLSNPMIREHLPEVYEAFKKEQHHWELRKARG